MKVTLLSIRGMLIALSVLGVLVIILIFHYDSINVDEESLYQVQESDSLSSNDSWKISYLDTVDNILDKISKSAGIGKQYVRAALISESSSNISDETWKYAATKLAAMDILRPHGETRKQSIRLSKPIAGTHTMNDAVFALPPGPVPMFAYHAFVGSLRQFGFSGDVVTAVPKEMTSAALMQYLISRKTVVYRHPMLCEHPNLCRFQDDFYKASDPRPAQPRSYIEYAVYDHWLQSYPSSSRILLVPLHRTIFQADPFSSSSFVPVDLSLFASPQDSVVDMAVPSRYLGSCMSRDLLDDVLRGRTVSSEVVFGNRDRVSYLVSAVLLATDKLACWTEGIESPDAVLSYLFYGGSLRFESRTPSLHLWNEVFVVQAERNTSVNTDGFAVDSKGRIAQFVLDYKRDEKLLSFYNYHVTDLRNMSRTNEIYSDKSSSGVRLGQFRQKEKPRGSSTSRSKTRTFESLPPSIRRKRQSQKYKISQRHKQIEAT